MIAKKNNFAPNSILFRQAIMLIYCVLASKGMLAAQHQSLKYLNENNSDLLEIYTLSSDTTSQNQLKYAHKKSVAVVLAILLGPFGVHRIYLGTHAKVPVIYTLTLGGGFGILPLLDIVAILSNKDWSEEFIPNDKVIMWAK